MRKCSKKSILKICLHLTECENFNEHGSIYRRIEIYHDTRTDIKHFNQFSNKKNLIMIINLYVETVQMTNKSKTG